MHMLEKLKKYQKFVIILLILGITGVPIVIHLLFKINFNIKWLQAEWSAGDILVYYGSVLSFLGTVLLSSLALWQNHEIKVESDKHTQYLEQLEARKNSPRFSANKSMSEKNNRNLEIIVENISENVAYNIEFLEFKMYENENIVWKQEKGRKFDVIKPGCTINIQLDNPDICTEHELKFKLVSFDEFNVKHRYIGKIRTIEKEVIISIQEIYEEENYYE